MSNITVSPVFLCSGFTGLIFHSEINFYSFYIISRTCFLGKVVNYFFDMLRTVKNHNLWPRQNCNQYEKLVTYGIQTIHTHYFQIERHHKKNCDNIMNIADQKKDCDSADSVKIQNKLLDDIRPQEIELKKHIAQEIILNQSV